jgi:hypothetical protein
MTERPFYASTAYVAAFGLPILDIPEWQTAVLRRPISGSEWFDALGCYPLCSITQRADLGAGLKRLRDADLVSLALVANPLHAPDPQVLAGGFTVCRPFKIHYLIDRAEPATRLSATHRRWVRKALQECEIARLSLLDSLGEWERLYRGTIERHAITGVQKFSSAYFAALAKMPEIEAIGAKVAGEIVAMALWVRDSEIVYYHLGASEARGYETQAMYGIFSVALEYFADARWIHLGGAAGVTGDGNDGLARFKRGFANRQLDAYFCGACLDPERYSLLSKNLGTTSFFPAYRQP